MSEFTEPSKLNGNGTAGVSIPTLYGWLSVFSGKVEVPELLCGQYAYACLWSLGLNRKAAFLIDPKDADILRTPFGAIRLTICKTMERGSIVVREGNGGKIIAAADNLQQINP